VVATSVGAIATTVGLVIAVRAFKMNKTDFDEKQQEYRKTHAPKPPLPQASPQPALRDVTL
jgi:hypothetical protein